MTQPYVGGWLCQINRLEIASKFCAALWFDTKDDAYLEKWNKYSHEARFGLAHRSMDPNEINGDWDKQMKEDLDKGEPDADQVWTESDSERESDEWVID